MPELSQYELEREANIARNRALLEQLELKQAVEDLGVPRPKVKPKAKPVQETKRKREPSELEAPRRSSARLRKVIDPNESPGKRRKREGETEKQREIERLAAEERARIAGLPRHQDLELSMLAEEGQDIGPLTSELLTITHESYPRHVADTETYPHECDKQDATAAKELRQRLKSMKIISRAKVTQNRVYSCAYHPDIRKDLIFFGDKHGQLGIWDARAPPEESVDEDGDIVASDNKEAGRYWRLQMHWPATSKSSISCIKFDPVNSHKLYTSSYDCTLRCLSFTTGISHEVYSTNERLICSIDLNPFGHELWLSDGVGGVTHLDLRQHKSKASWYALSDQKIGCISINPAKPHFLLTASNSRYLKIWDVRKLRNSLTDVTDDAPTSPASSPKSRRKSSVSKSTQFSSEVLGDFLESKQGKGCLRGEWRHDKSVSSAYWDARGSQIVSTSYDNTLRLWNFTSPLFETDASLSTSQPFGHIQHNCMTGKWLTMLRAQWNPNPNAYPHFTIGNMDHSLDVFSCKGELVARLSDRQRISAVQAVTASHPSIIERAVSGNGSGRCVLWATEDVGYS
ncbi:hypothetical protein AX17_003529 [Amanita inopinata Kibby_2008]|nr:hypothetical protein AX17_003529 [Amanita inopinata Kibby_2008]